MVKIIKPNKPRRHLKKKQQRLFGFIGFTYRFLYFNRKWNQRSRKNPSNAWKNRSRPYHSQSGRQPASQLPPPAPPSQDPVCRQYRTLALWAGVGGWVGGVGESFLWFYCFFLVLFVIYSVFFGFSVVCFGFVGFICYLLCFLLFSVVRYWFVLFYLLFTIFSLINYGIVLAVRVQIVDSITLWLFWVGLSKNIKNK